MSPLSLRQYLKIETRAAHQALDEHFANVDVGTEEGLALYLRMQISALKVIEPLMQSAAIDAPPSQLQLAIADLAALGHSEPPAVTFAGNSPHPVGIIYVIAGSHFGAHVLRKQWRKSASARVGSAGSFVCSEDLKGYWPIFTKHLSDRETSLDERDRICVAAKQCFATFRHALLLNTTGKSA